MLVGNGLFGGYPSVFTPGVSINKSNLLELMARGEKNLPTTPEQIIKEKIIEEYPNEIPGLVYEGALLVGQATGGGYGYGDALERDPQAVVDDIRVEIISDWVATKVYYVAYDAETWTADEEKTAELRQEKRKDRLSQAKSYADFEREWLKKKPAEDMLTYYGSWPDAKMVNPIIRI